MMTIKSDDVIGRVKVYESLVKGTPIPKSGIPESFRVLTKEFQALGLDITVLNEEGKYVELKELEENEKDSYLSTEELESKIDLGLPNIDDSSDSYDVELEEEKEEFEDNDLDNLEFDESSIEEGDE